MKASNPFWKEKLGADVPPDLGTEVDIFATEIDLRKKSKVDEKLFAETRLRRGAYGQRYDNGRRHDGEATQTLAYSDKPTKGPDTVWDAPGMLRIKIPFGGMTPEQCEIMADLAEEYSDSIAHVTTRQDFQLHFIHIEDTPAIMRRLAAVGITTREACGNSVRNLTACPIAGVCQNETFDVTSHARALTYFLLGHHDVQDFGRKFKIAFSGCADDGCGLANIHDLGLIAAVQEENGQKKFGFKCYVGGGLGAVPQPARLLEEFLPVEELLPVSQAIGRVFARLGEKKNRARARVKFLIQKLGIEEFKKLVQEERLQLPHDDRWTAHLDRPDNSLRESPLYDAGELSGIEPDGYAEFSRSNLYEQNQAGYYTVTIKLPLGDMTPTQLRGLADIARTYTPGTVRTTVEQNMVLRWIAKQDLYKVYEDLQVLSLARPGAEGITDIVSCPGTDTCKLGISASRGLAGELMRQFETGDIGIDETIRKLKIKISGCFNSCAQHHIADLGFYGVSRKIGSYTVPHFQVVLGGLWAQNAGVYGLPILAIPSKRIPDVIRRIVGDFIGEKETNESFHHYVKRIGKAEIKKRLGEYAPVPEYQEDKSFYTDWRDVREYTTGDMGIGECAGEVVLRIDFDLAAAERQVFEAQLLEEKGEAQKAGDLAYTAMLQAARGLVKMSYLDIPEIPDPILSDFNKRIIDTGLFADPYAGNKFGNYLIDAHTKAPETFDIDLAHQRIEEASLFVEACYACYNRNGAKLEQPLAALI